MPNNIMHKDSKVAPIKLKTCSKLFVIFRATKEESTIRSANWQDQICMKKSLCLCSRSFRELLGD
jgi:hypothetical protein